MTLMTFTPARASHDCDSRFFSPACVTESPVATVENTLPEESPQLPLNMVQAEDLMDRDGYVTVTVHLDQDKYLDHVIASATGDGLSPEDYAHEAAFGFGWPRESSAEITGVSGSEFIVSYTTFIREYLDN
ncbi:hypothetical protein [Arthrobacter koreensis]|uniref:hypothetical protein n=1 Tax=Arthrobacter koreensis TaxID=199136 RepID=UPI0038138372